MLSYSITGQAALLARVGLLQVSVQAEVQHVIEKWTEIIARTARSNAPVDEGDLRSTIRTLIGRLAGEVLAGGIPGEETGKLVDYAMAVETGTKYTEAQPFMITAIEQHRAEFLQELEEAVRAGVRRVTT